MFVFGVDTRMQFSHSPWTTLGLFLLQWQQQAGSDDGEPLQDQREPRFQAPVLGTDMCSPPVCHVTQPRYTPLTAPDVPEVCLHRGPYGMVGSLRSSAFPFSGSGRQRRPAFSRAPEAGQSSLGFHRPQADVAQAPPRSFCKPVSPLTRGAFTAGGSLG